MTARRIKGVDVKWSLGGVLLCATLQATGVSADSLSQEPALTPALEQTVAWGDQAGNQTSRFRIQLRGCAVVNQQPTCSILLTNLDSVATRFYLVGDTTYALDPAGKVYPLAAYVLGPQRQEAGGFGANVVVPAEAGIPTAFSLVFDGLPADAEVLRVVLNAGDNGPVTVLGAPLTAVVPSAPIASTTSEGLQLDLVSCRRATVRLDCVVRVTNVQRQFVALSVFKGFGELATGSFREGASPPIALSDVVLGTGSHGRFRYLPLLPGLPMLTGFSVPNVRLATDQGALEINFEVDHRRKATAVFKVSPGATTSTSTGLQAQAGIWLFTFRGCTHERLVLVCTGEVTHGTTRTEALEVNVTGSYLATDTGDRVPLKVVNAGERRRSLSSGFAKSAFVPRDVPVPVQAVFSRTPAKLESTNIVIALDGGTQNAVFRSVPTRREPVGSLFANVKAPADVPRSKIALTASRAAALAQIMQSPSRTGLEREQAAEDLWAGVRDPRARPFLIASYREFLKTQIAAAATTREALGIACAGFDSLSRRAPCGRFLLLAPHVLSLGDQALYTDVVRAIAGGRIGGEVLAKVLEGLMGAPPDWRAGLIALMDDEPAELERKEKAGWQRQNVEGYYAVVLQLMMGGAVQ